MDYGIYKGATVVYTNLMGDYVEGEIVSIDDAYATLEVLHDGAQTVQVETSEIYLLTSLKQTVRDEADLAKNPIAIRQKRRLNERYDDVTERENGLKAKEQELADRETLLAEREYEVDERESDLDEQKAEIAELKRRNEVLKGQRDMCFRRLQRVDNRTMTDHLSEKFHELNER